MGENGFDDTSWSDPGSGVMVQDAADTTPAGAGGDPFADAPPDTASPETFDTGFQPGGDSQLSPFSPGGGFNFLDALAGTQKLLYGRSSPGDAPVSLRQGRTRFSMLRRGHRPLDYSSIADDNLSTVAVPP